MIPRRAKGLPAVVDSLHQTQSDSVVIHFCWVERLNNRIGEIREFGTESELPRPFR
jgi:hypothetical protein